MSSLSSTILSLMLSRYLFSIALWADRPSPRPGCPPTDCFEVVVLMREIATFSLSTRRTDMLPGGITVAELTPTGVCSGAAMPADAGGDVVMTMLAVPDASDVPESCDCSSS